MNREKYIVHVTIVGSIVNFLLVIFKFASGILGNSSAMVADAAHSLSDFASDIIVLLCVRFSSRPEDEDHAYGHGKFETLASVAIALILLVTGLALFWDAIKNIIGFINGAIIKMPGWLAFLAAIISLLVKEALYHYTMRAAKKVDSDTLKTNAWHHRSDSLSSIATLVGTSGAMIPGGKWVLLDPLAACLISLFIMGMALTLMRPGIDELMEKSLPAADKKIIEEIIASAPGVITFHHLRTRRMGINRAVEAHIKMDGTITLSQAHESATIIENRIKAALGQNTHVGIHMEPAGKENRV